MLTDWRVNTSTPQEGFSGLIERVTFHSEETGFAVLRVKVKGHRGTGDGSGSPCEVNAAEWNEAQCVVARRPLSRPAAPQISAPVHTEKMLWAPAVCCRIQPS
jgi:hypothetical protein